MFKMFTFFLSTWMMVLSLIPGNDFEEIVKVPAMFAHYNFHDDHEAGHLNFFDFIKMHYGQPSHQHNAGDHQDLPFFNHQLAPALFLVSNFDAGLTTPLHSIFCGIDNYPSTTSEWCFIPEMAIFNPPRVCC